MTNEAEAGEQGDFGFKSLKQMTKLTFRLGRYEEALGYYRVLLTYTKKGVTRNVAEKSINNILDYVSAESALDTGRMQEFYEVTMKALEEAKNDVRLDRGGGAGGAWRAELTRCRFAAAEHQDEPQARQVVA